MINQARLEEFIQGMSQLSSSGFNPEAVLAHAVLETGWFNHIPAKFNYFGMKPPHWWTGPTVTTKTKEFINGVDKETTAKWCEFESLSEGLSFYAKQIIDLYPNAWKGRGEVASFFAGLQKGAERKDGSFLQWSTNPNYANRAIAVFDQIESKPEVTSLLQDRLEEFVNASKLA